MIADLRSRVDETSQDRRRELALALIPAGGVTLTTHQIEVDVSIRSECGRGYFFDCRFFLKKSIVRCQASVAAALSKRGVVSLLKPCCVPSYLKI